MQAVQSLAQVIEDASFETKANETRYASELLQTAAEVHLSGVEHATDT